MVLGADATPVARDVHGRPIGERGHEARASQRGREGFGYGSSGRGAQDMDRRQALVRAARERLGRTLEGTWTLDELIGVGRRTAVYVATPASGAQVAVKILHAPLGAMREIRARFRRDGYLANAIGHVPGVVATLAHGVDERDGAPFLIQPRIHGVSIDRRVDLEPLDADQLVELAEQVLSVLVAAHAAALPSRGLEPRDLVLDADGRVHVLELGVARALDLDGPEGAPTLSPAWARTEFLAPEQVLSQSDAIGPATDLYSLAAVLYWLATGEPPHGASRAPRLAMATSRARPLATRAPQLPREVAAVVDRALAVRPDARWRSASEMLAAVRDVRASLELPSSPALLAPPHWATIPNPEPPITLVRARIDTRPPLRERGAAPSSRA